LREYSNFKARVANLEIDIKALPYQPEHTADTIEALAFAKPEQEGMPRSSAHSDRTSSVAIKWRSEWGSTNREMTEHYELNRENLQNELDALGNIIAKVDNAIRALSEDERIIVRMYYVEQKPWYDVAHEVQYAERHCRRLRTRAVWQMSKSIFGCKVMG